VASIHPDDFNNTVVQTTDLEERPEIARNRRYVFSLLTEQRLIKESTPGTTPCEVTFSLAVTPNACWRLPDAVFAEHRGALAAMVVPLKLVPAARLEVVVDSERQRFEQRAAN